MSAPAHTLPIGGAPTGSPAPGFEHQVPVPAQHIYTVAEVVSPSSTLFGRRAKPELNADAGIPCHWHVEPPKRPFIASLYDAGTVVDLPLAVGPTETITVEPDPADQVDP